MSSHKSTKKDAAWRSTIPTLLRFADEARQREDGIASRRWPGGLGAGGCPLGAARSHRASGLRADRPARRLAQTERSSHLIDGFTRAVR
jgi:hypothetical protein